MVSCYLLVLVALLFAVRQQQAPPPGPASLSAVWQ